MASLAKLGLPTIGRARVSPIGLEFTEQVLNAAQLEAGDPPTLRAYASAPYPVERGELLNSPAALKKFLKEVFKANGFSGRKVVTALPSADVRTFSVTYQVRPGQTDGAAIAKLMQDRIGEDLSQFVIDYMPVRSESRDSDRVALVLLSERSTVITYLEQLRKAGLDIGALEVSPVSIRRLVSTLIGAGQAPQNVLVINTGERETHLTMISGQRLLFDQEVAFGEDALLEQISIALDAPRDVAREIVFRHGLHPGAGARMAPAGIEDTGSSNMILTIARPQFSNLVAEIRRAVLFASSETRGGDVGQAFLMGSIARWPGAAGLLTELSKIPVGLPQPLPPTPGSTRNGEHECRPELVIPAGLALRGFTHA